MPAQRSPAETPIQVAGFGRRWDWPGLVSGAVLAAGAIAAYRRTFSVPLLFDDIATIAHNGSIRHWSTALFPPDATTAGGRPVLNLSLAINYAVSGTAVWSYHVLNLAIHVLAGFTLLGVIRRTLALRERPAATFIAFFAATLWTLHPLQTEAVTYISQRAESLMGLFYLLTLYCFIRFAAWTDPQGQIGGRNRPVLPANAWAGLSVAACLFGMATKEVMVSAPLMVLLYDRTFLAGSFLEAWRRRWKSYAGLGATWLVLLLLVLSAHGRGGTAGFDSGVSWWTYAWTQFPAISRYLSLSVWPHPLVFYYGTEWVTDFRAISPSIIVVLGLLAATAGALLRPGRWWSFVGFSGAWFIAILAPSSLIPINRQTAAEHRMYLALAPLIVLMVVGIYRWLGRAALPCFLALAAVLFAITLRRNDDYRSALALWTDTVAKCPENPYAHDNLACELEHLPGRTGDAIAQCEAALRLMPDDAGAHNNLGYILEKVPGRAADAIAEYEEALRLNPGLAEAHDNLGEILEKTPGRLDDAIAEEKAALRLNPELVEAHYNLGYALSSAGRTAEAIAQYEQVLSFRPDDAEAHNNLGSALSSAGRTAEAIAQYEQAIHLKPDIAEAHNNLGNVLRAEGRTREAIAQYEEALRLKPDDAGTHDNLGNALRVEGRTGEAIAQYEEALRLKPDDPASHFNLATALLKTPGGSQEAAEHLEATLRLQPGNGLARRILARLRAPPP